jgi:putative flippase GtrA
MRYAISGAIVTGFYLGAPLLLNDALGLPLQMAIPIAFVIAATLQFNLQRRFVFRHVEQFALSVRAQIVWYVTVGSIQYPVTALGTLIGPKLTGLSDRLSFLATSLTFSVVFFLFIRGSFTPQRTPQKTRSQPPWPLSLRYLSASFEIHISEREGRRCRCGASV